MPEALAVGLGAFLLFALIWVGVVVVADVELGGVDCDEFELDSQWQTRSQEERRDFVDAIIECDALRGMRRAEVIAGLGKRDTDLAAGTQLTYGVGEGRGYFLPDSEDLYVRLGSRRDPGPVDFVATEREVARYEAEHSD